jgi:hypothetical protein
MTTGREGATATLVGTGRVLLAGGGNPSGLTSAELYDPSSRRWRATGSMTAVHKSGAAALLEDGRVLVAGTTEAADVYSLATRTWAATGSLVYPNSSAPAGSSSLGAATRAGSLPPSSMTRARAAGARRAA